MVKINIKKTDIERILKALRLLEEQEGINRKDFIRLYKRFFEGLK